MKKITSYFLLALLVVFVGCKSDGAKVNIKADTLEGPAPLTVSFDISASEAVSLSEFHSYEVKIIEEGKEAADALATLPLNPEEMQFEYSFGTIGKYEVAVSIVDTYGGIGKGSVNINVTSPFVDAKWTPDLSPIYTNEFLELTTSNIGLKNVEYSWEVKKGKSIVLQGWGAFDRSS